MRNITDRIHRVRGRIMNRIFLVWFLQRAVPLLALEILALAIGLTFLARFFFVSEVVSNSIIASYRNPFQIFSYLIAAFLHTTLVKQIVVIVLVLAGLFLFREVNRAIFSYLAVRRREALRN
jgi:hypothetical protein